MLHIERRYREAGEKWPTTARTIASWAVAQDLWKPRPVDIISQCARELSDAMREVFFTDPQGRRVRRLHALKKETNGEQMTLWVDILDASPKEMHGAFQQRRSQILGGCHQLKNDVDSFNDNGKCAEPIQLCFDFREDLQELAQSKDYPDMSEHDPAESADSPRRFDVAS